MFSIIRRRTYTSEIKHTKGDTTAEDVATPAVQGDAPVTDYELFGTESEEEQGLTVAHVEATTIRFRKLIYARKYK